MAIGRFYAGIAALIWSPQSKKYLLLRRSEQKDFGAGSWECVTGRVDQGEGFEEALYREVREELGVQVHIEFLLGTTHFHRGKPIPENELLGLIYGCTVADQSALEVSPEHSEYKWVTLNEAYQMLPHKHWLRPVLQRVELLRKHCPQELREVYREQGFELTDEFRHSL